MKRKTLHKPLIYYIFSRLIFMVIAFCLSDIILPYYTHDDLVLYSQVTLAGIDPIFYLRQRQIWMVICAILNSVEVFRFIQLPRLINIFVGWQVIKELHHTMELMGFEDRIIQKATNFMAVFPIFIIFTCSEIKDVIFTWCVWALINQMFELIDNHHINIGKTLFCSVLGMALRFGIIESLLGIMLALYIWRSNVRRRILAITCVLILAIVALSLWGVTGGNVIFEQKTRIFLGAGNTELGTKTPVGTVVDIILKLFGGSPRVHLQEGNALWISYIGYLSIFNVFVLYWFFIWLFQRRKEWKEWFLLAFIVVWMVFLSYIDNIIYRQILFLQPVLWIMCFKAMYTNRGTNSYIKKLGSIVVPFAIYVVMFIYVRI